MKHTLKRGLLTALKLFLVNFMGIVILVCFNLFVKGEKTIMWKGYLCFVGITLLYFGIALKRKKDVYKFCTTKILTAMLVLGSLIMGWLIIW